MNAKTAWIAGGSIPQRSRLFCVCVALVTILLGLVWRLAPLHLPPFAYKYGGSVLYAIMLYWLIASALPSLRRGPLAATTLTAAFAIECFKLVHTPSLDAFRLTLAGKLLLGRFFSIADLIAYGVAVAVTFALDHRIQYRRRQPLG